MFYKFVGGDEANLVDIFDKFAGEGSLKFSSVLNFNDPFEFKFISVAPTRTQFESWHATYEPSRRADELENAWKSFSGKAADWNTNWVPRGNLLGQTYVLCLARRWDSHLMWAHYASNHRGFAIILRPEIVQAIEAHPDYEGHGNVDYRSDVPELRWFAGTREEMVGPLLFSKSEEWSYEREFRLLLSGEPRQAAVTTAVDPVLVEGVILGTRAPAPLIERALAVQRTRPEFVVRQVTSKSRSYALHAYDMKLNERQMGHML